MPSPLLQTRLPKLPFLKMNGLGNDFVVVEARDGVFAPTPDEVRAIADRTHGVGCDQLIAIERSRTADAFMRIWNADGSEVAACGNAARCVGWLLMEATGRSETRFETRAGLLSAMRTGAQSVAVDMGAPRLNWRDIPLAEEMDTRGIELQIGPIDAPLLHTPGCVNMGNPHVVFFVDDAETAPVLTMGPILEHHPCFQKPPMSALQRFRPATGLGFAFGERGVGETKACGTGACAAMVAASRRGKIDRHAALALNGGDLLIEWRDDDHVLMTGPVAIEFTGTL